MLAEVRQSVRVVFLFLDVTALSGRKIPGQAGDDSRTPPPDQNRKTNSGCQFPDSLIVFGRDDPTRTDDPYVPNVVRYQLRYIPMPV